MWVPKKYLGSWQAFPNMYVIFVSPAGRGRKTTTLNYADELLEDIPNIKSSSSAMTQQVLMKRIAEAPDCSISIRSQEFGTFIAPSGSLMFDFLTDMYDGKKRHDSDTLSRNVEFATNPCVNLLAATTPQWISDNMSESAIGGGFASRVIFVYEEAVRRRQIFYESLDYQVLSQMKSDLTSDLHHLSSNIEGEFSFEPDAKDFIEEWYRRTADAYQSEDHRTHGYYERKPAHAFKVAMLLHLAYSDELVITRRDFEDALKILSQIERKLPKAFQAIGKNPFSSDMDRIKEFIGVKGKVGREELIGRFYQVATPNVLLELISALVVMGDVEIDAGDPTKGDIPMYKLSKRGKSNNGA